MNYQDYKDARDASWRILIDCEVTELPVKISGVCRSLGVSVRRYTPAERDNNDGMSTVIGSVPTIMVSNLTIPARQRFTCAASASVRVVGLRRAVGRGHCSVVRHQPSGCRIPVEQDAGAVPAAAFLNLAARAAGICAIRGLYQRSSASGSWSMSVFRAATCSSLKFFST